MRKKGGQREALVCLALRRQASEQYFTSSQFLAQALRQVMGRWQAQHNLEGNDCLFPLKLEPIAAATWPSSFDQAVSGQLVAIQIAKVSAVKTFAARAWRTFVFAA